MFGKKKAKYKPRSNLTNSVNGRIRPYTEKIRSFTTVLVRPGHSFYLFLTFSLLSKVKIDSSFREAHKANQEEFRSNMEIDFGESALLINSIHQSLDTIDLYVLLNTLLNEGQMMERLYMIGLNQDHIRQLLTHELNIPTVTYILDLRHPSILWINDLEKDSQYNSWSSSYYDLLRIIVLLVVFVQYVKIFIILLLLLIHQKLIYHII